MSDHPLYFIQIHLVDDRWVPYGPTFRSMTSAEIWARRSLFGQDYVVTTVDTTEDTSDLVDAT
jgi:hypothetical protein